MIFIVLGEICSFFGALCLAFSTFSKTKKGLSTWQIADQIFNAGANFFLNSYSGVVINLVNAVRNALSAKEKFNRGLMFVFLAALIILGLIFNNRGLIGLIPIAASAEYTIALAVFKTSQDMRAALAVNLAMWATYDFMIMAYPMFIMDFIIGALSIVNFVRYRKLHAKRRAIRRKRR